MSNGLEDTAAGLRAGTPDSDQPEPIRACPSCGTKLPALLPAERCPVCQLRGALDPDLESVPATADLPAVAMAEEAAAVVSPSRFDHYELLTHSDGTAVELGHGGMGVTYKAFDTNLRCPVALKVVNPRYLKDESACIRFVREARAAARLRHPNVASVFHLGRKDNDYFYAMEFVEGETVDQLIKRRGPMGVELALDIVDQVSAALGAAHKEDIVHRDIKPANLMLRFGEDGGVNVKVIDFGLAKASSAGQSDPALSAPGSFAGTAHFASPEQCAGGEVDIRSDIYSLGATLWEMLTGNVPYQGTAAQVIGQHLHAPLPVNQLKHLPRPVVDLLKSMLEKDPARRPQSPSELRAALRSTKRALDSKRVAKTLAFGKFTQPQQKSMLPGKRWLTITTAGALLACASAVGFYFFGLRSGPLIPIAKSVAVLPFDNLSESKENEYFSDGLTSEVIYQLSKVADLQVIARTSVLRYKNVPAAQRKPLNEIGAELGVGALLESSVQRIEDRVKIVTILYDARTNHRLWGASYDREMKDVFAIQSDLAEQIAAALQAKLSEEEQANLRRRPTESVSAYELYLQGRALWQNHRQEENDKAIDLFRQALEQDPKFVLGYVGLSDAYIERVKRFHGEDFWLDSAIDLCQQAISLDPKQLRAYTVLANAMNLKGWFDRMEAPVRAALELAPNDWDANRMAAAESTEFRREVEMYASIRKCFATNPNDSWAPYELALVCWTVGDKDLAEKWMQRAINLEPDTQRRRLMECERLVYRGEYAEALPGLRQVPADLKTHYTAASDLLLFCSMQVGDWPNVIRMVQAKLKTDSENPTALLRQALALRASGQPVEARQTAERAVALAQKKLPTAKAPRWMRWVIAIGNRFLDRKDEAYQRLRDLLANGGFPDPVLGKADPGLDVFKSDSEFQSILADLDQQDQAKRARILEIEKSY